MYIKQVIIQGFRSYRDQNIIEPFSARHNVIVGRNGSGKSNFFFAIQFVLTDEFSHMRPEERQQLLHEGTGARVVSAFVEIIFDNSDNRLPIDKDEVSLRRVIGAKKDVYYLDKKQVTKSDVMNLLESAGFSRSNPYYVVKQGKINQLATSSDMQRLKLLREVAGTRVYDERKSESEVILKDTEGKREKINELLEYIEERLKTLEEEKEELKEYQKWDKMHRSLEFTIHDKELKDTRRKLESLEESREMGSEQSHELHKNASDAAAKIEAIEKQLKELSTSLHSCRGEKKQLEDERQEHIKQRAKMELDLKDLEVSVNEDQASKGRSKKELEKLEREIVKKQKELDEILPQYQQMKDTEEQCNARLKACEQRRTELYAKQGRGSEFSTKEQRDTWIKKEISSLTSSITAKERQIHQLRSDVNQLKAKLEQQSQEMQERNSNLEERRTALDQTHRRYTEMKMKRDELTNQRKELWRRDSTIDQSLQSVKEEMRKCERNLQSTASKVINNGLDSVSRIVRERRIQGVYGPLIENFTCAPKLFTAVEVTAGNRLFHVIVDTDKTASNILSIMNKQKMSGEVTFMPLNKLKYSEVDYPTNSNVTSMVDKLNYDPMFHPAMMHVFGKTLIAKDIDHASQFSKSENLDCVTLEGDQVSRRGALTGGYYDSRKSRLEMQRLVWEQKEKLQEGETEQGKIKSELEELDAQVTSVLSEVQKVETKQIQLRETYERQKLDVKALTRDHQTTKRALESKERTLNTLESDLQAMNSARDAMKEEMGTELLSQLTPTEQQQVETLDEEIHELQQKIRSCLSQRTKLESEKNTLENLLSNNLNRRRDGLQQDLEEITVEDRQQQLELMQTEFDHLVHIIDHNSSQLEEVEAHMDEYSQKINSLRSELEKWRTEEREYLEKIAEDQKIMERLTNKRGLLIKKREECMRKIRELGSLPADTNTKYQSLSLKELWKKLNHCNSELKKYSHVNKKALDQYVNFSEQKEKLISRQEELGRAHQAIVDLMDHLEQKKHEAIQFTFKQVSKNFSEVFKQLVPIGRATMIMKRRVDEELSEDSEAATASSSGSGRSSQVDMFTGISIKISFTGHNSETKEMQQLSGGQKSLVALTLIFAIQKCDPAPFYLFDEIDQALDTQHRKAVADMIHRLADNAQFITTTFRPELLESADKFYGVRFHHKVSHIDAVSHDEAKQFIEEEGIDK